MHTNGDTGWLRGIYLPWIGQRAERAAKLVEQAKIAKAIEILESENDPDLGLWLCSRALSVLKGD